MFFFLFSFQSWVHGCFLSYKSKHEFMLTFRFAPILFLFYKQIPKSWACTSFIKYKLLSSDSSRPRDMCGRWYIPGNQRKRNLFKRQNHRMITGIPFYLCSSNPAVISFPWSTFFPWSFINSRTQKFLF